MSGTRAWSSAVPGAVAWPPGAPLPTPVVVLAANRVVTAYYSLAGLALAGLDYVTGAPLWRTPLQYGVPGARAPVCGGLLVLASNPFLVAVALTGYGGPEGPNSTVWTYSADGGAFVWGAPYVYIPGAISPTLLGVMSAPRTNGSHVFVVVEASERPPLSDARARMLAIDEAGGAWNWCGMCAHTPGALPNRVMESPRASAGLVRHRPWASAALASRPLSPLRRCALRHRAAGPASCS